MKILSEHSSFEKFKALWKQIYRFFRSACQAVFISIHNYPQFPATSKAILLTTHGSGYASMTSLTSTNSRRFGIFQTELKAGLKRSDFAYDEYIERHKTS